MTNEMLIATRGSQLALIQSGWIRDRLLEVEPGLSIALEKIQTTGDKILDVPLAAIGGKGLFVKEIEEALLSGRAQLAVHSIKDMPVELPPGLHLAAIPRREDRRDALISRSGKGLEGLAKGARVGTSSLRRKAQLLALRPDLETVSLRGNVETRIRKMDQGQVEAVILAAAGLKRLGLEERVSAYLDPEVMLPAVGQGALGLECRHDDQPTNDLVSRLTDPVAWVEVTAERAFLARLEGGCQVPIACLARLSGLELEVEGLVADLDGRRLIRKGIKGPAEEAGRLGRELAEDVLASGAGEILAEVYKK